MGLLVSLFTALVLAVSAPAAKLIDRTVVTVNDEVILESDIEKFIKKGKSKSFQELFGGLDDSVLSDRAKILQLLIEEKIIDQQVKKLELQASEQEVDGQIKAILKRNNITLPQLTERIKQLGTSMADYKMGLRRQIERRALVEREIKPTLEVTEEQLRHFYQRNSKPSDAEQQYKIAHILIEDKPKGGVEAKDRADKIFQEIKAVPDSFDELAKEYSDDASSAENGGALGYFTLSQLAKEFRAVVPKTPPGKIIPPLHTKAGFHIVKVLDTRTSDFLTLSKEQKEAVRNQMVSAELERKMSMWLERKKNEAHIRFAADRK